MTVHISDGNIITSTSLRASSSDEFGHIEVWSNSGRNKVLLNSCRDDVWLKVGQFSASSGENLTAQR